MGAVAGQLDILSDEVSRLEDALATAEDRAGLAEERVIELEGELAERGIWGDEDADELREAIADVRRGVITLEELYERALGA